MCDAGEEEGDSGRDLVSCRLVVTNGGVVLFQRRGAVGGCWRGSANRFPFVESALGCEIGMVCLCRRGTRVEDPDFVGAGAPFGIREFQDELVISCVGRDGGEFEAAVVWP